MYRNLEVFGRLQQWPIGTHQRYFERYHLDSLWSLVPQDCGFASSHIGIAL